MLYPYQGKRNQEYLKQRMDDRWRKWLAKRIPASKQVVLNQKRVFILPTGMGAGYLATTFLLFIAGVNYNNTLVMCLSFLMVSLFVVTIVQTFANLSGLIIIAGKTQPSFAGGESQFEIILARSGNRQHHAILCQWHDFLSAPRSLTDNERAPVKMLLPTDKRGLFRPKRLKLQSDYPLGLCRAWTWIDLDMSAWVYPKPLSYESSFQRTRSEQEGDTVAVDASDDFFGLRNYSEGDSLATVDWKAFARHNKLYTKVYQGHQSASTWLRWEDLPEPNVEKKLSYLCYLVLEHSKTNVDYGLQLPNVSNPPGSGKEHELQCLLALAKFQS